MADKNDAREWWLKHRARFVYEKFDGRREYSQLNEVAMLTAYAAALTQERDALRRTVLHLLHAVDQLEVPFDEEMLERISAAYTALAAKESQPK